jgi:hypothetical protein
LCVGAKENIVWKRLADCKTPEPEQLDIGIILVVALFGLSALHRVLLLKIFFFQLLA